MKEGFSIPRKNRLWFPGAIYHTVVRGNHKDIIFKDTTDYFVYMKYLKMVCETHPFDLYSYCLMGNHIHLQIATLDDEIWKIMQKINWKYSMYFNRKYNQTGHLFQNRYYSKIMDSESLLLQTSRYIHLNPVKAGIVQNPIQYEWSSYRVFMGTMKNNLVKEDIILSYFQDSTNRNDKLDRALYKEYVECEDEETKEV